MNKKQNFKHYDLEERTFMFAKRIRDFVKNLPRSMSNNEDIKQLVRSSGSIGANYIEANEALSRKDFAMRIKISRKESKESIYWLKLVDVGKEQKVDTERRDLLNEATELIKIFSAIAIKSKEKA